MATRDSVNALIQQCEDAIQFANDQLQEGRTQEHYNDVSYTEALQSLENAYNDLAKLALSANSEQREQLHRMRLQLQQLQNEMITSPH
ncbi:YtzC family protein [Bacillus sp. Bva_UNVM-123]|uniref:YtzC family protein n=1 Tax=Bacillus sp. Bva_UNVM-123 TaxID=2829798 RepID=UPI00391F875D